MQYPKEKKLMQVSLETGEFSNTIKHNWLYSIKNNRFINGNCHKGVKWSCDYGLFPGYYLLWSLVGYTDSRGTSLIIKKIAVTFSGRLRGIQTLTYATLPFSDWLSIRERSDAPESLRDFLMGMPSRYHSASRSPPTKKQYSTNEINQVKEFLEALMNTNN